MDVGSVFSPNATKKLPQTGRARGSRIRVALCAVAPEIAMPNMRQPQQPDTCNAEAMPATNRASPSKFSRKTSEFSLWIARDTRWPCLRAITSTTVTTARAMPTVWKAAEETNAGENRCEDGEVDGHGEVFEHQDGQHDGRLAVTDPAEVRDHLGGDP